MGEATQRTRTVVAVGPRSVMRVAVAAGLAGAVSIAVATAGLVAVAAVTGAHRPIDRMFSAVQRGHHLTTSQVIAGAGAAVAAMALVGTVLAGALVALFANHVLPLTGGLAADEEDPSPTG
jgi:hypothetical protein